ncbi:C40 family peptidase [Mucilaginibacter sp. Bleaf8]|uniref:C40 family peptidase n=1 Tax=Mucilaginibacter sp. Bleaf8 TaxID=2834430 RepID=UPI001BD14530|nr:NlpC/P60 family protein [Mucilaginibacter sp. Bleaf8]MBS7566192.1 C40 family peptidase [Mucilaginibacter sp. Bleaf8]
MKKLTLAIALTLSILSTQAQTKSIPNAPAKENDEQESLAKDYFSQIMGVALSATSNVKLFQFVYDWIGTPYHLGGDTKRGIDCSGFAYQLYTKVFNTSIGNNSRNIFSMVNPVGKEELKEGDLIFFKIHSKAITHVGVYIGNGKFAHASSSKGVMISYLADPYWTRYYYKGGRLLSEAAENKDN